MRSNLIVPVVMCGGSGTRLWPVSRDSFPKPYLTLRGSHSSFQETLLRVTEPATFAPPLIIASEKHRFLVAEQVRALGLQATIIVEPVARDTAAAIAVASEVVARRSPDALVAFLAADHAIESRDAFIRDCRIAGRLAAAGHIVVFGIAPSGPSTSYGYIRPGDVLNDFAEARAVIEFCEKPDRLTAKRFVAEACLWNSGNFVAAAAVMREELERLAPDIAGPAGAAVDGLVKETDFQRLPREAFAAAARNSIDYAVMERTERTAVLRASFDWSDIGTWNALWDLGERDHAGNVTVGNVALLESENCYVHSEGPVVAVGGLRDIVVVSTEDATLVTPRERADIVKSLVDHVALSGHSPATAHCQGYQSWGRYRLACIGSQIRVRHLFVNPKARLSPQEHSARAAQWIVVSGTALVTVDEYEYFVRDNESIYIPVGSRHRLRNPRSAPLELIEVLYEARLGSGGAELFTDAPNSDLTHGSCA